MSTAAAPRPRPSAAKKNNKKKATISQGLMANAAPPPSPPSVEKKKDNKKLLWERGDFLGDGCCGSVISGLLMDGTPVAIKSATDGDSILSCRREKDFLDQLSGCPQIIRCYGDKYTISRKMRTYNIVLELVPDGSLEDFFEERRAGGQPPMDEPSARRYTRSMLRGLVHIHRNGVVHCDLKPDNVMLCGADEVKIIDFGGAMRAGEKKETSSTLRTAPSYLAPECIAKEQYGAPSDVWALGCTVYKMLTGQLAMSQPRGMKDKEFWALRAKGQFLPTMSDAMSDAAKDFLSKCFVADPTKRWTAEMLLFNHPFMAVAVADDDHHCQSDSFPTSTITSASSSASGGSGVGVRRGESSTITSVSSSGSGSGSDAGVRCVN